MGFRNRVSCGLISQTKPVHNDKCSGCFHEITPDLQYWIEAESCRDTSIIPDLPR
jgi:hypothetical protein